MGDNVGPDDTIVDMKLWASFDRLPAAIRRLIADAPYDYAVTPFLDELNANVKFNGRRWAVENLELELPGRFVRDVAEAAFDLYGPDHPQACRKPVAPKKRKKRKAVPR